MKTANDCLNELRDYTDLDWSDFNTICLGVGDYELDMKTGTLMVDKSVFDDFIADSIIRVYFPDEDGEPTYEYQMVKEDDDYIYMEYFGNTD